MHLIIIFSLDLYMAHTRFSFKKIYYIHVKVPHQVVLFWVQIHLMNVTLFYGNLSSVLYRRDQYRIFLSFAHHAYCLHSSNLDSFIQLELSQQ